MTANRAPISVVVPAWNAARMLAEAITSVQSQTVSVHEIVIIDDGSTDDTAAVAERLMALDSRIVVHRQTNEGPGRARDAGIASAASNSEGFVALLDADDIWLPTKLERQLDLLNKRPEVGAVFTLAQNVFDGVPPREPLGPMPAYLPSAMMARWPVVLANGSFAGDGEIADWVPWFLRLRENTEIAMIDELLVHRRVHDANFTLRQSAHRADYARHLGEALRRRRAQAKPTA